MSVVTTKYAEGSFGIISGTPYAVLEGLRQEGVYSSSRIAGIAQGNFNNVLIMYYTGAKRVLTNLLNWFKFDNAVGTTVYDVSDRQGSRHSAILTSGASVNFSGVDGIVSGAYWSTSGAFAYNASGHAVLTQIASNDFLTKTGTICCWVRKSGALVNQTIYCYGMYDNALAQYYFITFGIDIGNKIGYTFSKGPAVAGVESFSVSGSTSVVADTWTHIAVASNNKTIKLYVNGAVDPIASVNGVNIGQWFGDMVTSGTWKRTLGCATKSGTFSMHYDGAIDNLRIASFEMTPDQLKSLADSKL